jgi:hypothetical protein
MRKLITTDISATAQMPVKQGTWDFLQDAYTELIVETVKGLVGKDYSASTPYAITNLNNLNTPPIYQLVSGLILYQGVLYMSTGGNFTLTGANVAICTIDTNYQLGLNADPVEFTDGNPHNIHQIKTIAITQGATGTGTFDYSTIVFIKMGTGHLVGAAGEPAYLTGWDDGGFEGINFRLNRDGLVTVQGRFAANGTPAVTDPIFKLAAGYRPAVDTYVIGLKTNAGGFTSVLFYILATGNVFATQFGGANYANNDTFVLSVSFYNS